MKFNTNVKVLYFLDRSWSFTKNQYKGFTTSFLGTSQNLRSYKRFQ